MLQYGSEAIHGGRYVRKFGRRDDRNNRKEITWQTSEYVYVDERLGRADRNV